ncbi:MAG: AAA family ATPase [Candidatus Pacearchaeota archaeon]|nr:AAA family ATPase [Candidatus Pacearchaeota archaeon]
MKLKRIKIKDIRSYSDEEIIFPDGSVLLSGDIGSGKTSILLAIEYALFGLQAGQRGSALLANNASAGKVELEIEIDGKRIIIERGLKRGSKSVSNEYASITIENEKIESSITEIKTKILGLLNYPIEFIRKNNLLYKYTVYTPQEQMKQIILDDAESRLDVLRHVFGIDKYKRIKENLQRITSNLKDESRILQAEINNLEEIKNDLDSNIKFIAILEKKIFEKEKELTTKKENRKQIEKEVEKLEALVKEKENFKKEIEKTQIMLSTKREYSAEIIKDIQNLESKLNIGQEQFDESKLNEVITEISLKNKNIEELSSYLIEISSKLDSISLLKKRDLEKKNRIFKIDICPTCLQDVKENHKHNILNETERQISKNEKEEKILSIEKEKTLNNLEEEKTKLKFLVNAKSSLEIQKVNLKELNQAQEKIKDLTKTKESLLKDIDSLEEHLTGLKTSTFEFSKFDNLLKIKKEDLKNAFNIEKNAEIESAELRKELQITKKEIDEINVKITHGEKKRTKLIYIQEIEDWLSNNFSNLISFTEKNIMITLRKEFSIIFNKWFSMLTTDSFQVFLDESFSPVITQGDFELDYSFLSGGERTAVALAYRLALNQIINSILSKIKTRDLVILDEPTDGFSESQLDKVRDIFQELNAGQLIIVSHEQKIENFVDNIIRLKKENGISKKEDN